MASWWSVTDPRTSRGNAQILGIAKDLSGRKGRKNKKTFIFLGFFTREVGTWFAFREVTERNPEVRRQEC
jgi:hypothetical protein